MNNVFNNEVEMGLRLVLILNTAFPNQLDIDSLIYYDFFTLHTSDIGGSESMHPPVPNRFGELSVKRNIVEKSLKFLILKGLVECKFTDKGIKYVASDLTTPFIDSLNEKYSMNYIASFNWVYSKFRDYTFKELHSYVIQNQINWGSEISYYTTGLINE